MDFERFTEIFVMPLENLFGACRRDPKQSAQALKVYHERLSRYPESTIMKVVHGVQSECDRWPSLAEFLKRCKALTVTPMLPSYIPEAEFNRSKNFTPGPDKAELRFGSHPADRELVARVGEPMASEMKQLYGWYDLDPSIPVRREAFAKTNRKEEFRAPHASESHLAEYYGITTTDELNT